jgi:hypothetical protein
VTTTAPETLPGDGDDDHGHDDITDGRPALTVQEHALFPWLTAGKDIELAPRLGGITESARRDRPRPADLGPPERRVLRRGGGLPVIR